MEKYNVKDYGIFDSAVGVTKNLNSKINACNDMCESVKTTVLTENVFMGPIADSCKIAFDSIDSNLKDMVDNFSKIENYLIEVAEKYKEGDEKAANNILLKLGKSSTASEYLNPANISGSHLDFINSIKDGAVESYNEYGILPSLTMSQAILESGWGEASIGNNIFGIKAGSGWTGKKINILTGEQNPDGSRYKIYADFRDYDSISDSIIDHAELLSTSRYTPVREATNYKEACEKVRECGYATDLNYAQSLINIIEHYGLDQWDPK